MGVETTSTPYPVIVSPVQAVLLGLITLIVAVDSPKIQWLGQAWHSVS